MTSGPNSEQSSTRFLIGPWKVDSSLRTISDESTSKTLSPRAMDVLVHLASQPGEALERQASRSPLAEERQVTQRGAEGHQRIAPCPGSGARRADVHRDGAQARLPASAPTIDPSQTNGNAAANGERNRFESVRPAATDIDKATPTARSGSRGEMDRNRGIGDLRFWRLQSCSFPAAPSKRAL